MNNSRSLIAQKTLGEIRSFLDEIVNDTSRYRSLHNLTKEVEHQYNGRFGIELMQNAHDALFGTHETVTNQRIEFVFEKDEKDFGTLYVANDGEPFTLSNFKALSNLGQSDKDPLQSIGNKGIGFRSVLEISKSPQIYSRWTRDSSNFDGFCFGFDPDVAQTLLTSIERVVSGRNDVYSPYDSDKPLLKWDDNRYSEFRDRYQQLYRTDEQWLLKELNSLSPYTLPTPICLEEFPEKVFDFENRGFSTVVRLPLLSKQAKISVKRKLEELDENSIIFLQRVNSLRIVSGKRDDCYVRTKKLRKRDKEGGIEIHISKEKYRDDHKGNYSTTSHYWLWSKTIGDSDQLERKAIQKSVKDLPGKWPSVDQATVSLAVKVGNSSANGVFNIYLPTNLPSGCSADFSAPFYGDISRTRIDFSKPFNQLLLQTIARKSVDVILNCLTGEGKEEASTIIDILSTSEDDNGDRWWNEIYAAMKDKRLSMDKLQIALSDQGWNCFNNVKLLPKIENARLITSEDLRSAASYPIFVHSLSIKETQIMRIFERLSINPFASPEENATIIEQIANQLQSANQETNWNDFWHDVMELFKDETEPLLDRKVILGTDNLLHAKNKHSSIFFRPRVSDTYDKSENDSTAKSEQIPKRLSRYVAFLNEKIQVHAPRTSGAGGIESTPVRNYLASGLVEEFSVERIFTNVILNATPLKECKLNGRNSRLCKELLYWSLKLLLERSKLKRSSEEAIQHFGKVRAPCVGGWYRIEDSYIGPGWPGKHGTELKKYFDLIGSKESNEESNRLLLPPDDPVWGNAAPLEFIANLLERTGTFDGLRLFRVTPDDWNSKFIVKGWGQVDIPADPPSGFDSEIWQEYRKWITKTNRPEFVSLESEYEFESLYRIPGFEKLYEFDRETSVIFSNLILISISKWNQNSKWKVARIKKKHGQYHVYQPHSPLYFFLRWIPWIAADSKDASDKFRPTNRWYVPPNERYRGWSNQFSHLLLLPDEVSKVLDSDSKLVDILKEFGMPCYDSEKDTNSSRLLDDLAEALDERRNLISNQSVFIGQVKHAWERFHPHSWESNNLPSKLIVENKSRDLKNIKPSSGQLAYLPDSKKEIHRALKTHGYDLVLIESSDAKRLTEQFKRQYGDGIYLASELSIQNLVNGSKIKNFDDVAVHLWDEYPWLRNIVLTVFAFATEQSRGVKTARFREAAEVLRKTRIYWVEKLEVALWNDDQLLAKTPVNSLWEKNFQLLLAENSTKDQTSELAGTLQTIVERNDIEVSLRHVLHLLEQEDHKSEEIVVNSLEKINISRDQYQEVQHTIMEDWAWYCRLVKPILILLNRDAQLEDLQSVESEQQLTNFLLTCNLPHETAGQIMTLVKDTNRFELIGKELWKTLGSPAQLDEWNKCLQVAGEPEIRNDEVEDVFNNYLASIRQTMQHVVLMVISKNPSLGTFKELDEKLIDINCPEEFFKSRWEINFQDVVNIVIKELNFGESESDVVEVLVSSCDIDQLRGKLKEFGLDGNRSAIEIHAENEKLFGHVFNLVQPACVAWCRKNNIDEFGIFGEDLDHVKGQLKAEFENDAYIYIWDEKKCVEILKKLDQNPLLQRLTHEIDLDSGFSDLESSLGITDKNLKRAKYELEQRGYKQRIKKNTVPVCGLDFVNTKDNLRNLWEHICGAPNDNSSTNNFDLEKYEILSDQPLTREQSNRKKNSTAPRSSNKNYMSESKKNLIGLTGEIHIFRHLQKSYGDDVANPNCWISGNSLYKFPGNQVNDNHGCDFVIQLNGKKRYLEVKSTTSDEDVFELGSSEVKLALQTANKRNEEYLIVHVVDALSDKPTFRVLPNPYSKKHKKKYRFDATKLRVRYSPS